MGLFLTIGLPTYLALCMGIGKHIAAGMGSDSAIEREIVSDAFDGRPFGGLPQQKTPPV